MGKCSICGLARTYIASSFADHPAAQPLANLEWTAKYKEVDAGKELERTLKDRLEGNDMWKSQGIKLIVARDACLLSSRRLLSRIIHVYLCNNILVHPLS